MFGGPEVSYHQTYSAREWLSILRTPYPTQSLQRNHRTDNHTTTDHKEGEQLEDRRSVGASSCNSRDGTDQRVQSLMFMMMMIYVGQVEFTEEINLSLFCKINSVIEDVESLADLNYLGSILNADNKMGIEISERVAKCNKAGFSLPHGYHPNPATPKLQHTSKQEHTTSVVIEQKSHRHLMLDVFMSETC